MEHAAAEWPYATGPQAVLTSTSWGSGSSSRPWEMKQEGRGREGDFSEAHLRPLIPGLPSLITWLWGTGRWSFIAMVL